MQYVNVRWKLGEKWKLLACKAIINQRIENEWKDDLKKAEELADKENESSEFKACLSNHGWYQMRT